MCQLHDEPKLSELLSDPILHLLLKRDGVSLEDLRCLIEDTRQRAKVGKALNLGGRAAKTGAIEQMRRSGEIPPLAVNRFQHTYQ